MGGLVWGIAGVAALLAGMWFVMRRRVEVPAEEAQRVDAVILSLRTFRSRTPAAESAARQLHVLGTPMLGVVLTDPTLKAGEI